MADPGSLTPGAVSRPRPELRTAKILDDATEEGQEVRCVVDALDPLLASDPMPWVPYVGAAGFYYPKRDDRALIAQPLDGPPVILQWWPNAAEPDIPL